LNLGSCIHFLQVEAHQRAHLKACGIDKREDLLILCILSRLDPNYWVFVSTFFATRPTIGSTWKMPFSDEFAASLTHEQNNIVQMGTLKASNAHALVANVGRKTRSSSKHKGKKYQSKEEDSASMQETSDSEDEKPKKGKVVCSYCKKPNHGEDVCMKTQLAQCISILEKHNIKIVDNIRDIKPVENFEEPPDEDKSKEMGHTMFAATFSPTTSHEERRKSSSQHAL